MDDLTQNSQLLIYQSPDGAIKIDVRLEDETVWLTQEQIAILFGKGRSTITEHIANVYSEGELQEASTSRKFRQVLLDGNQDVGISDTPLNMARCKAKPRKSRQNTTTWM